MKSWMLGKCQNNSFHCISKASKNSDLKVFENCQSYPMYFTNMSTMVTLKPLPRRIWRKQWWGDKTDTAQGEVRKDKFRAGGWEVHSSDLGKREEGSSTSVSFHVWEVGTEDSACHHSQQPFFPSMAGLHIRRARPYGSCTRCVVLHSALGITRVVIVITRQVSERMETMKGALPATYTVHLYSEGGKIP